MASKQEAKVMLEVERRESAQAETYEVTYEIPYRSGMTYMDALRYIADEVDTSLAFYEHSCKRGFCGACLIQVDGKKTLSCRSLVTIEEAHRIKPALKVDKDYFPLL